MPVTKSAKKAMRQSERKALRGKALRSRAKTMVVKTEAQVSAGDAAAARTAMTAAVKALDKAAAKGKIHPNNAARRKSRLMKKVNQAGKAAA